jgi:hypothetical protein
VSTLNGKARPPKIEDGIPIPPKKGHGSFEILDKMKRGQSVLFPDGTQPLVRAAASRRFGKGCYAIRTVKGGVRCWRLK